MVHGAFNPAGTNLLTVTAGSSTIRGLGLVSAGAGGSSGGAGIRLSAGGNVLEANWLGINPAAPNTPSGAPNGHGIFVSTSGNTIGGTGPYDGNVIGRNAYDGILIATDGVTSPSGNALFGNFIGVTPDGNGLGDRDYGVNIGASGTLIGGTIAGSGNVISGNENGGIRLWGSQGATSTMIKGDLIGLRPDGAATIPTANAPGIWVESTPGEVIGGPEDGARNVISGNGHSNLYITGTQSSDLVLQGKCTAWAQRIRHRGGDQRVQHTARRHPRHAGAEPHDRRHRARRGERHLREQPHGNLRVGRLAQPHDRRGNRIGTNGRHRGADQRILRDRERRR